MRGLSIGRFSEAMLVGLCFVTFPQVGNAGTQLISSTPPVGSHRGWLEPEFKTIAADLKRITKGEGPETGPIDPTVTLEKLDNLKEMFVAKRTAEYEKERLRQVVTARAKAGRTGLFEGRDWKKSFTTASTSGILWQVDSHKYRETSGVGDRRHSITAMPNGFAMQVAAKEVYMSQTNRGHSWITGELTVTYVRNPLWIRLQCEHDWNELLKKIGGQ